MCSLCAVYVQFMECKLFSLTFFSFSANGGCFNSSLLKMPSFKIQLLLQLSKRLKNYVNTFMSSGGSDSFKFSCKERKKPLSWDQSKLRSVSLLPCDWRIVTGDLCIFKLIELQGELARSRQSQYESTPLKMTSIQSRISCLE